MTQWLKQSTAFTFRIGPFVDDADGVTPVTNLTIAQADIQLSKAGGAFAQTSASPTTTHDADGWYQCPLTTTDTGTLGALTVQIVMAGALPVWKDFMVLPPNTFDSLVAGTDYLNSETTGLTTQAKADVNAEVVDVLRTDTIPDSYAADGAQPTIAQAILAIQQYLQERSVSGTTVTVKKPDGSTTAMTFTLDSNTAPTSQTRAS